MSRTKLSVFYSFLLLQITLVLPAMSFAANWNPVSDTGEKWCYDNKSILASCPAEGEPFYGQDYQYVGFLPTYEDLGPTFIDSMTDLEWQDGIGGTFDWNGAVDYCEQLDLGGHTDWRLPEVFELSSLYEYKLTSGRNYWAATPYAPDNTKAWILYYEWFHGPLMDAGPDVKTEIHSAQCVRGAKTLPGTYIDNGDTVTDTATQLTWTKGDFAENLTWEEALAWCESVDLDGETDWRLPNIKELFSLVDFTTSSPSINLEFFLPPNRSMDWSSSTTHATYGATSGPKNAHNVRFSTDGSLGSSSKVWDYLDISDLSWSARCVRGGLVPHPLLYVSVSGNGSVIGETVPGGSTVIDCGATCSDNFTYLDAIELTATPQAGSTFVRWGGNFIGGSDCDGDTGTCTIKMMEDDASIIAYFRPHQQLTVATAGLGDGLVTSAPVGILCGAGGTDCDQMYAFNTSVELTATASSGTFWYWSGDACSGSTSTTCTVSMASAKNITANFLPTGFYFYYSLAATKSGTGLGTITSSPPGIDCGSDCDQNFISGTEVTLTATPDPNSVFTRWNGTVCSESSPTCTVTMDQARDQDAIFTLNTKLQRELTVTIDDGILGFPGSVTSAPAGIDCGADCTGSFDYNTPVTLTATPGKDAAFAGWSGDACDGSTDPECIVTMDGTWEVTASFGPEPAYKLLSVTKDGNGEGTVTSSPVGIDCGYDCNESYDINSQITLTATPASGTNFTGWTGGGCSGTGDCQVTLTDNTAVNATFEVDPALQQELAVTKDGTCTGLVVSYPSGIPSGIDCGSSCNAFYALSSNVDLLAAADLGCMLTGWSGDTAGGCLSATQVCTVTMDQPRTITATFGPFQTNCSIVAGTQILPEAECLALMDIYNSTDGPNWSNNTGWNQDNDPCGWYGVTCSAQVGGAVAELSLFNNNLVGTIPATLDDLTELTYLDLSENQLTGSIPPELGNLTNLWRLSLHTNQLTGPIPPELGNLAAAGNLTQLYLSYNQLSGTIPQEIGQLTTLKYLKLNNNLLCGEIPTTLTNLVNLWDYPAYTGLDITNNGLYTNDTALDAFIVAKGGDWQSSQNSGMCPSTFPWNMFLPAIYYGQR